jgi:hypothetical protein
MLYRIFSFSKLSNSQTGKLTLLANLFWVGGVVKLDSLAVGQFGSLAVVQFDSLAVVQLNSFTVVQFIFGGD